MADYYTNRLISSASTKSTPNDSNLTAVQVAKCSHVWQIANFSRCGEEVGEFITSSRFAPDVSSTQDSKLKFRIHVYPKGESEDSKDFISIFLQLVQSGKGQVICANSNFSIRNSRGKDEIQKSVQIVSLEVDKQWGIRKLLSRAVLFGEAHRFLEDDRLTIYCEVRVISSCPMPPAHSAAQDTRHFGRASFSDTILRCGSRQFPAHRDVLSAKSPVFRAMFGKNGGCLESISQTVSEVDLGSDIKPEVVEAMLEFIYTGQCSNLGQLARDLLPAADKYQLDRLKALCEQSLASKLTIDSAADTLAFADLHSANQLRRATLKFINGHAQDFAESSGFKQMLTSKPTLAVEVYRSLAALRTSLPLSEPPRRSSFCFIL